MVFVHSPIFVPTSFFGSSVLLRFNHPRVSAATVTPKPAFEAVVYFFESCSCHLREKLLPGIDGYGTTGVWTLMQVWLSVPLANATIWARTLDSI
ncbi:hypothetical protein BV22DRAFT_120540 [Leucogyrophana mollusca]|uniref:Uncharacterized protein n=1 Tax=Leucogyrophana mollusca TaxID=85980 RepID=A0ACB8BW94_9AGAM|nr:hypothetical protein BV22DRAFT_120540 [Leucogyrophana mollusca]